MPVKRKVLVCLVGFFACLGFLVAFLFVGGVLFVFCYFVWVLCSVLICLVVGGFVFGFWFYVLHFCLWLGKNTGK